MVLVCINASSSDYICTEALTVRQVMTRQQFRILLVQARAHNEKRSFTIYMIIISLIA